MKETLEVKFEEREERFGRRSYRAAIRFAPGPYGEVFTDWYMGKNGAELAIDRFCSALTRSTVVA